MEDNSETQIFTIEEIKLAWLMLKQDIIENKPFANYQNEIVLYSEGLDIWLETLLDSLNINTYNPKSMYVCNIPKTNFGIRPGGYLNFDDRIVYYLLMFKFLPYLKKNLIWSKNKIDFANIIKKEIIETKILDNHFKTWKRFRRDGLEKINSGDFKYVLFTDITGYYENINIEKLTSDLRQIGIPETYTKKLSDCLKKWSFPSVKGLPQGYTVSDLLSKIYLNPVDKIMISSGYVYTRYSDDIRVFCKSKNEAKKSLMDLTIELRNRGLNLQSAKTFIIKVAEASEIIDGVNPLVIGTIEDLSKEILSNIGPDTTSFSEGERAILDLMYNPYITVSEIDDIAEELDITTTSKVFQTAFNKYFLDEKIKFEHTLFRFLLASLGRYNDEFAVEYCLSILDDYPEETLYILKYFEKINAYSKVINRIISFLNSEYSIYDYQIYQILCWYSKICIDNKNKKIIKFCRKYAFNYGCPFYLRSISKKILGDMGDEGDIEKLNASYANTNLIIEQAEIMMSLKNMEKGRRNAFLNQAAKDGFLNKNALSLIKKTGN